MRYLTGVCLQMLGDTPSICSLVVAFIAAKGFSRTYGCHDMPGKSTFIICFVRTFGAAKLFLARITNEFSNSK